MICRCASSPRRFSLSTLDKRNKARLLQAFISQPSFFLAPPLTAAHFPQASPVPPRPPKEDRFLFCCHLDTGSTSSFPFLLGPPWFQPPSASQLIAKTRRLEELPACCHVRAAGWCDCWQCGLRNQRPAFEFWPFHILAAWPYT